MSSLTTVTVTDVHHWSDDLFSFRTTRESHFRFKNGQFVMIGLEVESKPLLRAYSIASPNYAEELEFFSIKVPEGALTSRLQHIKNGDQVIVGSKATGTLILDDLLPGKNLFLLATGTGLAPFISIIQDLDVYERFEKVILVHSVRKVVDLAYQYFIEQQLPQHDYLGEQIKSQLIYYPTVTREPYRHQGRITTLMQNNKLTEDIGLANLNPDTDRVMICGNSSMLADCQQILDNKGFHISPRIGEAGHYVIERAFVEK